MIQKKINPDILKNYSLLLHGYIIFNSFYLNVWIVQYLTPFVNQFHFNLYNSEHSVFQNEKKKKLFKRERKRCKRLTVKNMYNGFSVYVIEGSMNFLPFKRIKLDAMN